MNVINILLNIILICIFGQLATISHEFGHAIPALVFTKDKVQITFGNTVTKMKQINFNGLSIRVGTFQPFLGFVYYNESKLTKLQKIVTSAAGPIVSLIIGLILIFISEFINYNLLRKLISFSAYYHIGQFICTLVPVIYPKWWSGYGGYPSDGHNIISIIKNR